MNTYPYPQTSQPQQQQQHHQQNFPQQANGINPAMFASYQRGASAIQLMNPTAAGADMAPGGINPAMLQQLHHQQFQQQQGQQHQQNHLHHQQIVGSSNSANPAQLFGRMGSMGGGGSLGPGGGSSGPGPAASGAGMNLGMGGMSDMAMNGFNMAGNMNMNMGPIAGSSMMNGAGPGQPMSQQGLAAHQRHPSFSGGQQQQPHHSNTPGASSPPSGGINSAMHFPNQLSNMTPQQLQNEQQKAMLQRQAAIAVGNNAQHTSPQNFYPQQRQNSYPSSQLQMQQGSMYPPSNPQSSGMMPPQLQHQQSHPVLGSMMHRPGTSMSTSSHHSSSSHPPHLQQPARGTSGTPAPMLPPGGQSGNSMPPPNMQQQQQQQHQHQGQQSSRPSTALSFSGNTGGSQQADQQQHPPPISRPGTSASIRQPSLGPTPGTPMGMPPPPLRTQTPGYGQNQSQREASHPPSRPQTAQSNHGFASTPTSAHGHGPAPPFSGSPTTPVSGIAGGSLSNQQRGSSVPLSGAQLGGPMMGGQMGAQRSVSVAPGMNQAPGNTPAPPQSPAMSMSMSLGGNAMGPSSGGMKFPSGTVGGMQGMSTGMMPPPQLARQASLGPPSMSPRIPQGMGEQAQTSGGFTAMMNGVDGLGGSMQQQHPRQQSPQRPMSRASINGVGPIAMNMNIPLSAQAAQKMHGFTGQQAPGMNMLQGMSSSFAPPSTPIQSISMSGHHQSPVAQTPPRSSAGTAAVGRGSAPPMSAPSTPNPLASGVNMTAPLMTPVRSGSEAVSVTAQTAVSAGIGASSLSTSSSQGAPSIVPVPLLPPLPTSVRLSQAITRMTAVPLAQSAELIPPISDEDIENIKRWKEADLQYEARYTAMRDRTATEVKRSLHGTRPRWWEQDPLTESPLAMKRKKEPFKFDYPSSMTKESRRKGRKREGLKVPGKLKEADANRFEQLVPIRLEFDVEHHKYRDSFVWNLNDPIVTPEAFAQSVIDDYGLSSTYHSIITKSIQEQLSDYKAHSAILAETADGVMPVDLVEEDDAAERVLAGRLSDAQDKWWTGWREKLRNKNGYVRTGALVKASAKGSISSRAKKRRKCVEVDSDVPLEVEMFPLDEDKMHEEMRILVKLDITVGSMKLDDQFEWDIRNSGSSPEEFAAIYCDDLQLGGEFKTAISHMIREQVQAYQKSLFLVGHPSDGSAVQDDDLRMSFLQGFTSTTRTADQSQTMQPVINYLSDGELDRIDKERERELNKRRKRATRGRRGVALPDREPIKTQRTPAIGFPEIDPSTLAQSVAANAPTARRAAAAAASVTIANMVASENGGSAIIQPTLPLAPQAPSLPPSKIPKARGSFKPPEYPQMLLRKRAETTAPPTTTAADVSTFEPPLEGDMPLPPLPAPVISSSSSAPESKLSKGLTQKKQREREKEAKEKEYVDGQRANMIDGVWHCSNCGCPETVAVGRRKGPLGDKSQCGACGKFWHRHRRPRPVEYNAEEEYHVNLKLEAERAKASAKKKGGAAALRALALQDQAVAKLPTTQSRATPDVEPSTPTKTEIWVEIKSPSPKKMKQSQSNEPYDLLDRALSPASSVSSSASEKPLARKSAHMNGNSHRQTSTASNTPKLTADTPLPSETITPPTVLAASTPPVADGAPSSPPAPQWMLDAVADLRKRYPDDRFETMMRYLNNVEQVWRVKCLDCPGKLYTPGPGETLENYELHLKNKGHRVKVNTRLAKETKHNY